MSFLRALPPLAGLKNLIRFLFIALAANALVAFDDVPTVIYKPSLKLIEGDQPLTTSYVLTVTSPFNLVAGTPVTVTLAIGVNKAPAGVSTALAKSFVTLGASSLTFTGPNQAKDVTVAVNVPVGTEGGDYVWAISTTGWASGTLDPNAFINAKVTVPQQSGPPTVTIGTPIDNAVFNQLYSALPFSVPLTFTATSPTIAPITSIDADLNGTAITLTPTGLGTSSVTATGNISLALPGVFTVRARATNNVGTSTDTTEITLNISAPAPVVAILTPTASNFVYSGTTLSVPFSFTGTSAFGNITALSATLNGTPLTVTQGGLASLLATGSGTLAINAAGTYTLVVSATSAYGTSSTTKTFSVSAGQTTPPPPTVTISQPLNGAVITRVAGSAATSVPFAFTAAAGTGTTITSIKGTLNGNTVTVTQSGIGSATANGSGNFSVSAAGTYTFVASAVSAGGTASKSVTFTVKETQPPAPDCTISWCSPSSQTQKGGCDVAIRFTLDCGCRFCGGDRDESDCNDNHRRRCSWGWGYRNWYCNDDRCDNERDTSVVIFIYEIKSNGSTTEPDIFTYSRYGRCSSRDDSYAIDDGMYKLDYAASRGTHRYHIDVYRKNPSTGATQLLGTKEFTTK